MTTTETSINPTAHRLVWENGMPNPADSNTVREAWKTLTSDEKITVVSKHGYGWISNDDLRKIILMVHSELVLDAVFTPLPEHDNP